MHILVVEDEKKISDFIKRGLKEEGYAVSTAYDGEDALYQIETNPYDVIILDVMIPKKNGVEVCKAARAKHISTPILMLTAKDAVEDKVAGLDAGADDYLVKPFAFEELLARLRVLLRQPASAQATQILVGDLSMDLLSHKVHRAGKEINLTTKEFAMLEYLMRNAGKIITRTMISEHVWDIHFDTMTNVIDVYINYLRKKIDEGFDKKLIMTVRGRGYRIQG